MKLELYDQYGFYNDYDIPIKIKTKKVWIEKPVEKIIEKEKKNTNLKFIDQNSKNLTARIIKISH